jgi:hypothetical protein
MPNAHLIVRTGFSPFLPDDALVEAAKRAPIEKQLLCSNPQNQLEWQEFDEEPRRLSLEANRFKPLEAIADVFDHGLEGLDGRQRAFVSSTSLYTILSAQAPIRTNFVRN